MKKVLIPLLSLLAVSGLTACESSAKSAELVDSYTYSEIYNNTYSGWVADTYQVHFYEDDLYEMVYTSVNYGFGMIMSSTASIRYGTFTKGMTEDGYTAYELNKPSEFFINSYSTAGGFSIAINTADEDQTYPTELPAKTQGEKNMADNKEDVLNSDYATGFKIYTEDSKNVFSFTDPNETETKNEDGSTVKATISTASGDVSKLITKEFKDIRITDRTRVPGSMGEGSYDAKIDLVITYKNDTYDYYSSTVQYGYSQILGTTTVFNHGSYAQDDSVDGYTKATLATADDVLLNSFSKAGGFNIQINTADEDQTYPTELPAKTQGEKNMADSKDDVIEAYGQEYICYFKDNSAEMSLTDPNA